MEDAQKFAKDFKIPNVYDDYEKLCQDPKVEAIYIGAIHTEHAKWAQVALKNGKHVLCEKPLCVNAREVSETYEVYKSSGKFLMEAMWTRFVPAHCKVRELIESGIIGKPKVVQASFGFKMSKDADRLWKNNMGGGAVLDLGVYPITFANMVFGEGGKKFPTKIVATGELTDDEERVDTQESITLQSVGEQFLMCRIHDAWIAASFVT